MPRILTLFKVVSLWDTDLPNVFRWMLSVPRVTEFYWVFIESVRQFLSGILVRAKSSEFKHSFLWFKMEVYRSFGMFITANIFILGLDITWWVWSGLKPCLTIIFMLVVNMWQTLNTSWINGIINNAKIRPTRIRCRHRNYRIIKSSEDEGNLFIIINADYNPENISLNTLKMFWSNINICSRNW